MENVSHLSPAELAFLRELQTKVRTPWERNGYEDGLAGRDDRVPEGRVSVRDIYKLGWYDGEHVRKILEA